MHYYVNVNYITEDSSSNPRLAIGLEMRAQRVESFHKLHQNFQVSFARSGPTGELMTIRL